VISEPPKTADCIVVFAGGVGESGKAGQGYEERVQYAVELYKKGYAGNILFSSGYRYIFNEPLVMKALAISLNVPEQAIAMEENAKNTYENVVFSRKELIRYNWRRIIVVSSPYHMRRVSLVFKKSAKDIAAIYAPIRHSLFYSRPVRDNKGRMIYKRINIQQIKAIIHEYLAIVYYWWRGVI
jgi:uncharacterized SAM-binding protein YcdF (DUF218 family)